MTTQLYPQIMATAIRAIMDVISEDRCSVIKSNHLPVLLGNLTPNEIEPTTNRFCSIFSQLLQLYRQTDSSRKTRLGVYLLRPICLHAPLAAGASPYAAKRYHPDISPEEEDRFRQDETAYETLSDLKKKAVYDEQFTRLPVHDVRSYPSPYPLPLHSPYSMR
jgi:hypothetical protein